MVILSRAAHFEPGYLFGVLAGLSFKVEPSDHEEGRSIAIASLWLLLVAFSAWLIWVPVEDAVVGGNTSFILLILDALLATTWVCGVQSLLFDLIPLRYLDGEKVMAWSKLGWLGIYAFGMFIFVQLIMHPQTDRYGGDTHSTLASMLILFIAFTVVSVVFWAYFRLRWGDSEPEAAGEPVPSPDAAQDERASEDASSPATTSVPSGDRGGFGGAQAGTIHPEPG